MNYLHVIGHYWEQRRDNLTVLVKNLNEQGCRPFIWNNSRTPIPGAGGAFTTVHCPSNPIHGRYLAALIHPEIDYFLFQDDDLILSRESIDLLFSDMGIDQERFYGIEGRRLQWDSLTPYTLATPDRDGETTTDMCIRAYACHRRALSFGLDWILHHGVHPGRSETILFTGGRSTLVPGASWKNLPEGGVGLYHNPNHDREIDEFVNRWMRPE